MTFNSQSSINLLNERQGKGEKKGEIWFTKWFIKKYGMKKYPFLKNLVIMIKSNVILVVTLVKKKTLNSKCKQNEINIFLTLS